MSTRQRLDLKTVNLTKLAALRGTLHLAETHMRQQDRDRMADALNEVDELLHQLQFSLKMDGVVIVAKENEAFPDKTPQTADQALARTKAA